MCTVAPIPGETKVCGITLIGGLSANIMLGMAVYNAVSSPEHSLEDN